MERLPLHRQLNQTQAILVKIAPIWLRWSTDHLSKIPNSMLVSEQSISSVPIDVSNGVLKINCFKPIEASQIKHQQASLIEALHTAGFDYIKRIKVSISLQSHTLQQQATIDQPSDNQQKHIKPSKASIKSIEVCGHKTHNVQLSESLHRLADTLNKTLREID